MIKGRLVDLRAVEPGDLPLLARWLNDPDVMIYWGRPGTTLSLAEVQLREQVEATRGNSRKFMIQPRDADPIGQIDYYDLDWQNRSAWMSVMVGDSRYWGGGYGTDAVRTLLDYLFRQLNLNRVTLNVHESNTRAMRSYEKNGFVREGVMRQWAYFNGGYVDGVLMAVLREDFERLAPAAAS